jgi:catechol 2,3-dioxygenase-like lactoylglutathione lyase family enzyme
MPTRATRKDCVSFSTGAKCSFPDFQAGQAWEAIMINGAHLVIYSTDAEADRAFLRDVLQLPFVDVGHGWLIFGLPPAEVAVHPAENDEARSLYFMCDDLVEMLATLAEKGIVCEEPVAAGWGQVTQMLLPGGGKIGLYQPRHARPKGVAIEP